MLDIFEYFHWIVLPVKDFGHDLHVALRNAFFVPKFFEICKSLIDSLFLSLLIFAKIGFVTDFICIFKKLLLSKEGS